MANSRKINEQTFGGQLHHLRKVALISFDEFRMALGVTKTYLNDVETNFVRPPTPKMQLAMAQLLSEKKTIPADDFRRFFDLAAKARGELPADVYAYLANNPSAVDSLRDDEGYAAYVAKIF